APSDQPLRLEYVQAKTLTPNPANWRTHPQNQRGALRRVLDDPAAGWAGAILFNRTTGRPGDGHCRLKGAGPHDWVAVLIGRWSETAERRILASLDPIANLARAAADKLEALLGELEADGVLDDENDPLAQLLNDLPDLVEPEEAEGDEATERRSDEGDGGEDGYEPGTKILLVCRDGPHQEELIDLIDRLAAGQKATLAEIRAAFRGIESRA